MSLRIQTHWIWNHRSSIRKTLYRSIKVSIIESLSWAIDENCKWLEKQHLAGFLILNSDHFSLLSVSDLFNGYKSMCTSVVFFTLRAIVIAALSTHTVHFSKTTGASQKTSQSCDICYSRWWSKQKDELGMLMRKLRQYVSNHIRVISYVRSNLDRWFTSCTHTESYLILPLIKWMNYYHSNPLYRFCYCLLCLKADRTWIEFVQGLSLWCIEVAVGVV